MNTTTVCETSDPENHLEYTGTLLASNTNSLQSWKILDTKENGEMLFINDIHQSSKKDEYYYHEMFVHSLLFGIASPKTVLVLGGSEGCMAREILKWDSVKRVVQVDWDESLLNYFKVNGYTWNSNVYENPRLEVIVADAFKWIQTCNEQFDAIFIDLFDPSNNELQVFQNLIIECKKRLSPYGGLSVNAGIVKKEHTPACILANFIRDSYTEPKYHRVAVKMFVPSFEGTWVFLQVVPRLWSSSIHDSRVPDNTRYFTKINLLDSIQWSSEYPKELRDYWLPYDTNQIVCKKLTPYFDRYSNTLISEFYGC